MHQNKLNEAATMGISVLEFVFISWEEKSHQRNEINNAGGIFCSSTET